MKKFHRLGGKFSKRSADDASVGTIIAEFKAMDGMLDKLIKDLQEWRNGWEDILRLQCDTSEAFAALYRPVEPTTHPEMRHVPQETPRTFMVKCTALHKLYSDTKDDLKQETDMIATKLIRPIEEAKGSVKALHQTLKHRENMKLDYERYLGKVEHARKRSNPSPKEMAAMDRYENDLAQQQIAYSTADQQIVETFPPVVDAVISLMPLLLTILVELQTTLVGSLYTSVEMYCRKHNLPSPAVSDGEIISKWDAEFTSFRQEVEQGFFILRSGQAIHRAMSIPEKDKDSGIRSRLANMAPGRKPSEATTMVLRPSNGGAFASREHHADDDGEEAAPPRPPRPPVSRSVSAASSQTAPPRPPRPPVSRSVSAASSETAPPPVPPGKPAPSYSRSSSSSYLASHSASPFDQAPAVRISNFSPVSRSSPLELPSPGYASPPSRYTTPPEGYGMSPGRLSPAPSTISSTAGDYFEAGKYVRRPSTNTVGSNTSSLTPGQYTPGLEEILAAKGKKKPPPPVPSKPKPKPATAAQYVIALYDFEGQNSGDLPFRVGDRIRVVKRTESTDDWWQGELNGSSGQFPANYVRV